MKSGGGRSLRLCARPIVALVQICSRFSGPHPLKFLLPPTSCSFPVIHSDTEASSDPSLIVSARHHRVKRTVRFFMERKHQNQNLEKFLPQAEEVISGNERPKIKSVAIIQ